MREVRISPSPNIGLYIRIADQMEKDFRECRKLQTGSEDGPDCTRCSWKELNLHRGGLNIVACALPEVKEAMEETEMKRVTWKTPDGKWGVGDIDWDEIDGRLYGALYKLMAYEESGLSPEEVIRLKEDQEEDRRWS